MTINAAALLSRVRSANPIFLELHSRVYGKPILAELEAIRDFVDQVMHDTFDPEALSLAQMNIPGGRYQIPDGQIIGLMDVSGPLAARAAFCGPLSYDSIRADFSAALEDPAIDEVVIRINSPGGEASGAFELSDFIYESRGKKPITAIIDPRAGSAAYAIASAADKIVLGRTGAVGSVGAFTVHMDRSERDKQMGVKFEFISAGEHKVEGNPHEPLTAEARERIQGEIDQLYDGFVELVARNRDMSADEVRELGAIMFTGEDAIEAGLADEIGTLMDYLEGDTEMPKKATSRSGAFASAVNALAELAAHDESPELSALQEQLAAMGDEEVTEETEVEDVETADIDPVEPETPEAEQAVSAEDLIVLCTEAGQPALASTLLKQNLTLPKVEELLARISAVEETAGALGLDGKRIAALIDDPAAMIRMALSEQAESLDADIDGHVATRSRTEVADDLWSQATDIARGKVRRRA